MLLNFPRNSKFYLHPNKSNDVTMNSRRISPRHLKFNQSYDEIFLSTESCLQDDIFRTLHNVCDVACTIREILYGRAADIQRRRAGWRVAFVIRLYRISGGMENAREYDVQKNARGQQITRADKARPRERNPRE